MRCVARWLALCALVVVIKEISSSVQPEDDIQPEQTQQIQLSKCPYCHQCTDSCYEGPLRNAFRFKGRQYYIPNPNLARICPRRKDRNGGIVPCIRPCPGVDEIGCNEDQTKININGQAEIFAQARSSDNHFSPNDPVANNHEATTNSDCDLTDLEKSFSLIRNDNLGNARGNVEDHKHKTDSTIDYSFTGSGHSSNSGLIENVNEDQVTVQASSLVDENPQISPDRNVNALQISQEQGPDITHNTQDLTKNNLSTRTQSPVNTQIPYGYMDGFATNSPSNSPITNTNQVYGYKYSKNINNHPVTSQGMFYNNAVNPNWQWIQQNGNKTPDQAGGVQTGYTVQKSTGQEIGGTSPYFPYFTHSGESDHGSKGGISWFGGPAKFKDQTPATFNTQDRNYSIQQKTDTYIDGTSTQSKNEDDGKLTQSIGQESIDSYGYFSHVDSEGTGKLVDQGIQTPETHYSGNAGHIHGGRPTQNYVYDGTQFGGNKHQSVDQGTQTPETHYSGNAGQIHGGTHTQYNVHGRTQFGEGTGKSVDQGIQTPETHYSGNAGQIHGEAPTQNNVHDGIQFSENKHQLVDQGIQTPERHYTNIGKTGQIHRGTPTQYNVHGGTQFGETTSQSVYGNIYGTKNEGSGTNYGYFKVQSTGHETKNVDTYSTNAEVINNVNNGENTVKTPSSSVHPFDDKRGIQSPTFYEPSSAKLEYGYPSIPTIPNYGTTSLYGYDFPGSRYSSVQFSTVGRTNQQTKPSDFEEYRKSLQGGQDSTFGEEYNAGPNEGNSSPTGVLIEGGNSGVENNEDGSVSRTGSYISTNKDGPAIDGGLSSSYPNNGNRQGQSDSAVDYLPAVKQSTIFSYRQNGDGSELVGSNSPSYEDNFTKVNRNTNDLKDGKIYSGKPKDDTPSSKKSYVSTSSFRGTNIFEAGQPEDRPSFYAADNSQKELSFDGKKSTTDQTTGTQYDGEGSSSTALGITGESGKEVSTFNRRKSNTSPDDGNKVVNVNGYSMTKRQLQDIIDSFKNVDKCVFTLPKVCSGPLDKYIHVINSYPDSASINDGFVRLPSDVIVPLPCYKSIASVYAKDSPLFSDKSGEVLPSGHFVKYTTSCNILASAKTPEKVSIVTPQGIVVPYDVHSKYMKSLSPKDKKKLKVLIPNEHKPISFGLYKEYLELYAPDSPAENKSKEGYIKLLRSKTKIPLNTFISILENYKNLKDATVTLPSGQSIPFPSYLKIAGLLGEEYNQKCVVNVPNTDTRVPYTVMEDVCNTYLGRKPNDLTKDTDVNFVFPRPRNPYAEELDYGKSSTFEDADAYSEYKYGEQYTYGGPYKYGERDYNRYDSHRPRSKYFLTEAADDVDPYSCCPSSADPPHSPATDRESILDVLHPGHTDLVGYCPHHRYCNRHKKSTISASA